MALKFQVDSLEEIPDAFRDEYVQKDGHFVLALDGELPELAELKGKVKSFRDNNIKAQKERDEALIRLRTFDGIDPNEVTAMRTKVTELERLTGSNDPKAVQTLILQQVQAAIAPYEQKERERSEREAKMSAQLARKSVETALRDAATKAGVDEVALPDFLHRGLDVFTFEEERVIAKDASGAPVFSKMNPGNELTPEEWAFGLSEKAPHLFRTSSGGGAPGGTDGGEQRRDGSGVRWVNGDNALEVGKNLEDIATGRARVASSRR